MDSSVIHVSTKASKNMQISLGIQAIVVEFFQGYPNADFWRKSALSVELASMFLL